MNYIEHFITSGIDEAIEQTKKRLFFTIAIRLRKYRIVFYGVLETFSWYRKRRTLLHFSYGSSCDNGKTIASTGSSDFAKQKVQASPSLVSLP